MTTLTAAAKKLRALAEAATNDVDVDTWAWTNYGDKYNAYFVVATDPPVSGFFEQEWDETGEKKLPPYTHAHVCDSEENRGVVQYIAKTDPCFGLAVAELLEACDRQARTPPDGMTEAATQLQMEEAAAKLAALIGS